MPTKRLIDDALVLINPPDWAAMDHACEMLNSDLYPDIRDELRKLVLRWQQSGPNLTALLNSDQTLAKEVLQALQLRYIPGDHGRACIQVAYSDSPKTSFQWAATIFAGLTLNPRCEQLGGPCSYGPCGKYFIREGKRRTLCCSRRCCQLASGTRYTKHRLEAERQDKLARATVALKRWRTLRTKDDWKTSVCKQEPDITVKFLTRAVTKGDLVPPKEGK